MDMYPQEPDNESLWWIGVTLTILISLLIQMFNLA